MIRFAAIAFFAIVYAASAQTAPAQFAFVSTEQSLAVGAVSEQITLQAEDTTGTVVKLPQTGCVAFSSSGAGEFSSSASNWSAVSVLTMNKNSSNRNFYYKGIEAGAHTLSARVVLKPDTENRSCASWPLNEWPTNGWNAHQTIVVGSGSGGEGAGTVSVENPPPSPSFIKGGGDGGGGFSEPVPSLLVNASVPSVALVGADADFSATVFGAQKEPIANPRVLWSFGNGATREGSAVRFAYNIPGSYAVVVSAASGGLSGMARVTVQALAPEVHIARIVEGVGGLVEIENSSARELDVSGWGIASGATLFTIPPNTFLLPKSKVAFPASVTGVFVVNSDARLLFHNGKVAAAYVPPILPVTVPVALPMQTPENPSPPSPPPLVKEGEGGGFISSTAPAAVALSVSDRPSILPWLFGTLGVGVLGVASLAAFRFKPVLTESAETDETKLAKSIRIDGR